MAQGHGISWLRVRFSLEKMKYLFIFKFLFLWCRTKARRCSATPYAMHPEPGRKWGTECLNSRFPLPTMLCTGYSVKLKKKYSYKWKQSVTNNSRIPSARGVRELHFNFEQICSCKKKYTFLGLLVLLLFHFRFTFSHVI